MLLADPMEIAKLAAQWWGPPGVVGTFLAAAIWYLYKDAKRIQEKRVAEAKESAETARLLAKEMSTTIADMSVSIRELISTAAQLRDVIMLKRDGGR